MLDETALDCKGALEALSEGLRKLRGKPVLGTKKSKNRTQGSRWRQSGSIDEL